MPTYKVALGILTSSGSHRVEVSTFREEAYLHCANHPQLDDLLRIPIKQVPTTCARNKLVKTARENGVDVLVMIDDDMGVPPAFFKAALAFLFSHKGPAAIAVPYCTAPPLENVNVFEWASGQSGTPEMPWAVTPIVREDAARRKGVEEVANVGTGCVAYKMSCFEAIQAPYYRYGYNEDETEVTETEDCYCHRRLHFAGVPLFVHWDHWSIHYKGKAVGRPVVLGRDDVVDAFIRDAEAARRRKRERPTPAEVKDYQERCMAVSPTPAELVEGDKPLSPGEAAKWAQGVEGWMAPEELFWLAEEASNLQPGDTWVEVGSWKGRSASAVYLAMPFGAELVCIDTWDGRGEVRAAGIDASTTRADFDSTMRRIVWEEPGKGAELRVIHGESATVARGHFHDGTLAVVFIDAAHDYDSVKADLEAWLPKVKPGGMICGHDASGDVGRAIHDVLQSQGLNPVNAPGSLWYCPIPETFTPTNGDTSKEACVR